MDTSDHPILSLLSLSTISYLAILLFLFSWNDTIYNVVFIWIEIIDPKYLSLQLPGNGIAATCYIITAPT